MASRKYEYPVNELHAYRTKFDMSHTVKGSFDHGKLIPFDVIEVLPGDTFKVDLASIIRMSTPIAPIMDNIHMFASAWFVPNRLVDDNWEQLMGANKDGAWIYDANTYVVPTVGLAVNAAISNQSIGDYMGLPLHTRTTSPGTNIEVSALPARGYALIWNEFFRSEVVSAPIPIDHSSNNDVVVSTYEMFYDTTTSSYKYSFKDYSSYPLPLGKYSDYFTKALPTPIKHDPVPFIPELIPVGAYNTLGVTLNPSSSQSLAIFSGSYPDDEFMHAKTSFGSNGSVDAIADVNQAWNTIEALRVAFQVDKFYWKDGAMGSRYYEILEGHFGVKNKDGVLQLPQKLGELRWRINVDQVLSTSGYSASSSTTVGAPGANSVTTQKGSLFTFSATEHGFIFIVGGTRHDHTYHQGYTKQWLRSDRLDFYDPVFANIGEQPVYERELFGGVRPNNDNVFGYQEAWAEYRYIPDRVCGYLRPSSGLGFWTLADHFSSAPALNDNFIYENRDSISRALVTGSEGPDFIFDIYFKVTAVREMPLFSIPGLVDHH